MVTRQLITIIGPGKIHGSVYSGIVTISSNRQNRPSQQYWRWNNEPARLKLIAEQAEQALKPMSDLNNTLASMVTALSTLSTSLPEGLKPHIDLAMQELDHQRQLAENGLKTSLDGLRKDIKMIEETPLWK